MEWRRPEPARLFSLANEGYQGQLLYEQLTPTKLHASFKTRTTQRQMQNVWQSPGEPCTYAIWLLVDAKQVPSKTNTDVPIKEIGKQLKGAGGSEGFRKDERKAMAGTAAEPKMG